MLMCDLDLFCRKEKDTVYTLHEDGEGGGSEDEEKREMKSDRKLFRLTLVISVLVGLILPLAIGLKEPTLIAIFLVWFGLSMRSCFLLILSSL
jgi:hypothetical protein